MNDSSHKQYQNVIVIRHGDRMDNFEPSWVFTAPRPWDPPLIDAGKARAFSKGLELRDQLLYPIHRVFVSPFLRCVQTATQVVYALCSSGHHADALTGESVPIDPSKIKVSIELGLCEMLNREAIRVKLPAKDGDWGFNISELEAILPAGTLDTTVERVYKEMPQWEETIGDARSRYKKIIQTLADKYPSENLLLVTHGEGVGCAVSAFLEGTTVFDVEYCGYAKLGRPFFHEQQPASAKFEVLTEKGQTGVNYRTSSATTEI